MNKLQKPPRVVISMQLIYKYPPKDYHGTITEWWSFGKGDVLPLHELIKAVVMAIIKFYLGCLGSRNMNDEISSAGYYIASMEVKEFMPDDELKVIENE